MSEGNGRSWSSDIKDLGDKIAALTITKAVELKDYLKEVHKIEAAAGGGGGGGGGGAVQQAAVEAPTIKTEFTPTLEPCDASVKIKVIKVVREITALGLAEAKAFVEGAPKPLKENISKEDAEAIKKKVEEQGGKVTIK